MASKISGVGVHTIRAWEKRYQALVPSRDGSGHRTYTKSDIEKLMLLSELCLLGYTISKVAKLSILELKELLKDLGKTEEVIEASEFNLVKEKPHVDPRDSQGILTFALKAYKIDVINQEIGKLKSLITPREMAFDVLLPLSQEIEQLVASGSYTNSQEQLIKSFLRFHSNTSLYRTNERKEKGTINVLLAGIDSEESDLALISAGLLCNHYGYNFTFFCEALSSEALSESINFLNSNIVILCTSKTLQASDKIYIQSYLDKLANRSGHNFELILNANTNLVFDKIATKRFAILKTLDNLDDYLISKN